MFVNTVHSMIGHVPDRWYQCELSYGMGIIFGIFVCISI